VEDRDQDAIDALESALHSGSRESQVDELKVLDSGLDARDGLSPVVLAEVRATARALLFGDGELGESVAVASVSHAAELGVGNFPSYWLAEAYWKLGLYSKMELTLEGVGDGWFEAQGLDWRAFRVLELRACTAVQAGSWDRVRDLVCEMNLRMREQSPDDPLVGPFDLTRRLIADSTKSATAALKLLWAGLPIADLLDAATTAQVVDVLAAENSLEGNTEF
jgi:hypothetical protein